MKTHVVFKEVSCGLVPKEVYRKRLPCDWKMSNSCRDIVIDYLWGKLLIACSQRIVGKVPAGTTHLFCHDWTKHIKQGDYIAINSPISVQYGLTFQFYARATEIIFDRATDQWLKHPCNKKDGYIIGTCTVKVSDCIAIDASNGHVCEFFYSTQTSGDDLILDISIVNQHPDKVTIMLNHDIHSVVEGMKLEDYYYVSHLDPNVHYRNDLAALVIERFFLKFD